MRINKERYKKLWDMFKYSIRKTGLMDNERIANDARRSLSKYCYEECSAYCCRKGYLVLTEKEADIVTQGKKDEMIKEGRIKELKDGKYSMNLSPNCPSLVDNKCIIHKSHSRPKACKDFPLFLSTGEFMFSGRCPAVRQGKLIPYSYKLVRNGMKYIKPEDVCNVEVHWFE